MPRKPKPRQQITMKRGGWGLFETGEILRTVACTYTVGGQTFTGQRHVVAMPDSKRNGVSNVVRFLWAENLKAMEVKAA